MSRRQGQRWARWVSALVVALCVGCGDDGGSSGTSGGNNTASTNSGTSANANAADAGVDASDDDAGGDDTGGGDTGDDAGDTGDGRLCVAVRGNGPRIFAHFGAMARIHEHYGLIDGVSGGSSGSITSFLTESIYANPHVFACGDAECDPDVAALRVALLFKSFQGYFVVLANTEEAIAFQQLAPVVERAQAEGIGDLVESGQLEQARQALLTILTSEDLGDLVNREVLELLAESPDVLFHTQEMWEVISTFGSFAVDSDRIFVRPGLVDFEAFARKIGRIGSFYASYGPADAEAWGAFLDACAPASRGLGWAEIAALPGSDGQTCGEEFGVLAQTWRDALLVDEGGWPSRIDDPVGGTMTAMISTSVLVGDAVDVFAQARAEYVQAQPYTFDVGFDDVRFGYWSNAADASTIEGNPEGFTDAKTAKALSLRSDAPWLEPLSLSPAEPGLTRALEIGPGQVSAGGWSDLAPVLVLRNAGCDSVILITRRGPEIGGFGASVAGLLGMDDATQDALYALDAPDSAITTSLREAAGVWCTDWDAYGGFDTAGVFNDAYNAPLQTTSPRLTGGDDPYANVIGPDAFQVPGCTPGVNE